MTTVLEQLRADYEATTGGEWHVGITIDRTYGEWPVFRLRDMEGPTEAEEKAVARFIEHAHNRMPLLLALADAAAANNAAEVRLRNAETTSYFASESAPFRWGEFDAAREAYTEAHRLFAEALAPLLAVSAVGTEG